MRPFLLSLVPVVFGFVAACGSGGSDSSSSSSSSSSSGGTSSSGGSSSGASSGGPDASSPACAPLVEEALPPSAIAWEGAPRCSVDGVCTVYPAPTAEPPSRIRSVPSGSTWAVGGDVVYRWNGTQGKVYSLDVQTHLQAIAPISDDDVWVVGEGNTVAHWNGAAWTVSKLATGSALGGVAALATNDVWAVGNFGVAAHWTGGPSWSEVSLPGSPSLHDVWAVSANDVWAAEWNGGLWHYDGSWSKVASAGTGGFDAVWSPGAGDVWALGGNQLHRGNASNVAPLAVPGATSLGFDALWGSSSTDVWVSDTTSMFHFANGTWTKTANGARWITGRAANDVYALGETHVRRWDGVAWNDVFQVGFPALNGAWRSPNGEIWFAGAQGTILRMKNGELRRMTSTVSGLSNVILRALWGAGDGDVWFGSTGPSFFHVVGGEICAVKNPGVRVTAMSGSAADDIWAIGGGKSAHWDGAAWTEASLANAESVYAVSKTDAWATGGPTVQRWNGTTWSAVTMPVVIDSFFTRFGIVTGTGANDVWIPVSQFGDDELLRWNGTEWQKSKPPGSSFRAVSARTPTDVWMLDWDVHHFDGVEWKTLTEFPRRNVSAAIATDAEIWIATTDGGVLRLPR